MKPRYSERKAIWNKTKIRRLPEESAVPPEVMREIEVLTEWLALTRKWQNPVLLSKVQLQCLLCDLATTEGIIREYKKLLDAVQSGTDTTVPEEERDEAVAHLEREIHRHEQVRCALKDIGDGLAWRAFEHRRFILQTLADSQGTGYINLDGLLPELSEWSRSFDTGSGVALLNVLTNYLRTGDVTVLSIDKDESVRFEFVEVKSRGGNPGGRYVRQRDARQATIHFLNEGMRIEGGTPVRTTMVNTVPEHYFDLVRGLMETAIKKGSSARAIGDHLWVECIYFPSVLRESLDDHERLFPGEKKKLDEWKNQRCVLMSNEDRYNTFLNGLAPYSVFPIPELYRVLLMAGGMVLRSFLNLDAVAVYAETRGWSLFLQEEPSKHIGTFKKGAFNVLIPGQMIGRLGMEFLKPRSLIAVLEELLARGSEQPGIGLRIDQDESMIWD